MNILDFELLLDVLHVLRAAHSGREDEGDVVRRLPFDDATFENVRVSRIHLLAREVHQSHRTRRLHIKTQKIQHFLQN